MSSVNFEDSVGYFCGNIFNTVKYGLLELGQGKKKKKNGVSSTRWGDMVAIRKVSQEIRLA